MRSGIINSFNTGGNIISLTESDYMHIAERKDKTIRN